MPACVWPMPDAAPVIALDGTAGSGKGAVASLLATQLGWRYLDSGALYRTAALAVLDRGIDPADGPACGRAAADMQLEVRPAPQRFLLDGTDVTARLRHADISQAASRISAHPEVRRALLQRQRAERQPPGLVAEGRDMGTVVFPDALLKAYLTAALEERARRRRRQLKELGINANLNRLTEELEQRDRQDAQRGVSPLVKAPDACLIDTTQVSIEEACAQIRARLPDPLTRRDPGNP